MNDTVTDSLVQHSSPALPIPKRSGKLDFGWLRGLAVVARLIKHSVTGQIGFKFKVTAFRVSVVLFLIALAGAAFGAASILPDPGNASTFAIVVVCVAIVCIFLAMIIFVLSRLDEARTSSRKDDNQTHAAA